MFRENGKRQRTLSTKMSTGAIHFALLLLLYHLQWLCLYAGDTAGSIDLGQWVWDCLHFRCKWHLYWYVVLLLLMPRYQKGTQQTSFHAQKAC